MHDRAALKIRKAPARGERRTAVSAGMDPLIVRFRPAVPFGEKEFLRFCQQNSELRIERDADGALVIMPPLFSDGGQREAELTADFVVWARATGGGKVYGPSTGFTLPNGALRSPDVSWVRQDRWDALTAKERASFTRLCPDFVLELRSRSDRLPVVQKKMAEYLANGARLGWLIDPLGKQVFIYRPDAPVERLKNPATLSGEPVLAGFTLDLARVW